MAEKLKNLFEAAQAHCACVMGEAIHEDYNEVGEYPDDDEIIRIVTEYLQQSA